MNAHKHTSEHIPHSFAHVQCPCGQTVHVPVAEQGRGYNYEIMAAECNHCGRIPSAGNGRTGQITGWMTARQVNQANDEYAAQEFTCDDVNDW